jgi:glycosyltransferase involved in cell wall biosynthesis
MSSPRILIISYNWPPRNAIGTHRPYSWAKYWSQWGADVTVLTACKCSFDEPLDLNLPQLEGVRVLEMPYLSTGLRSSSSSIFKDGAIARLKAIRRFLVKSLGLEVDIRRGWFRAASRNATAMADQFDAVVSTYGPAASHLLAAAMKRRNPALRWTADYRDLWATPPRGSRKARQEERVTVGRFADALTTVSDELAEDLQRSLGQKSVVIYNGFDSVASASKAMQPQVLQPRASEPQALRIVYTGLITPGDRDPTLLFRAIKQLEPSLKKANITITVEFYGARLGDLKRIIAHESAEDISVIFGHVNRDTALQQQMSADALLMLESPEKNGNLTGKIFEYLAAGRPIISIGSRKQSAIGRLLGSCGSGICIEEDIDLLKGALLDLAIGVDLGWFQPREERILEYSRENQARKMLRVACP